VREEPGERGGGQQLDVLEQQPAAAPRALLDEARHLARLASGGEPLRAHTHLVRVRVRVRIRVWVRVRIRVRVRVRIRVRVRVRVRHRRRLRRAERRHLGSEVAPRRQQARGRVGQQEQQRLRPAAAGRAEQPGERAGGRRRRVRAAQHGAHELGDRGERGVRPHRLPEAQRDIGRYGEMWGDVGRCREIWGDAGRCREVRVRLAEGDIARYSEI